MRWIKWTLRIFNFCFLLDNIHFLGCSLSKIRYFWLGLWWLLLHCIFLLLLLFSIFPLILNIPIPSNPKLPIKIDSLLIFHIIITTIILSLLIILFFIILSRIFFSILIITIILIIWFILRPIITIFYFSFIRMRLVILLMIMMRWLIVCLVWLVIISVISIVSVITISPIFMRPIKSSSFIQTRKRFILSVVALHHFLKDIKIHTNSMINTLFVYFYR